MIILQQIAGLDIHYQQTVACCPMAPKTLPSVIVWPKVHFCWLILTNHNLILNSGMMEPQYI